MKKFYIDILIGFINNYDKEIKHILIGKLTDIFNSVYENLQ